MKVIIEILGICLLLQLAAAPPPRRTEQEKPHDSAQEKKDLDDFGLEYSRYLREVIELLESDPEFKKKLEDAHEADIRNGQIAKELEYVDHNVRTKLDEVKRQEIERLRHLAQKQVELSNGIDNDHVKVSSEHLDHENPHTFEMEDLKKLIAKVSADLNEADEKRRKEFKEYEMQKEFEKQQKLQHLQGSEREAFEKQLKENETKHKQHEPLHEPGSKQQLEEVWEKQDHMENQEFDPKVFFQLHDVDGNGFWDHNEVKALFLKELDKMYQAGAPEDDMRERVEEMERMREHVFNVADKDKDGLLSYDEFIDKTRQPEFQKDPGWETIDQKPVYTHEEYLEFEKKRQEEIKKMVDQGLIPPQPVYNVDPYHAQGHYAQYHQPQYAGHAQQHAQAHQYPNQQYPQYQYQQHGVHQPAYPQHNQHAGQQAYQQPQVNQQGQQQQQQQVYQQPQVNQQPQINPQQQQAAYQQPMANQAPPQPNVQPQVQQTNQQPQQQQQMNQQPQQQQINQQSQQQMNQHPQQTNTQQQQQQPQQQQQQAFQQPQQNNAAANQINKGNPGFHDPNDVHHPPELNLKYSNMDGDSQHPNVISSQTNTKFSKN